MYNKIKSLIFLSGLTLFFFFVVFYYFSEENQKKIVNNRIDFSGNIEKKINEIPMLENDSKNIIKYHSSDVKEKKIKKRYFWELLKNNDEQKASNNQYKKRQTKQTRKIYCFFKPCSMTNTF